MTVNLSDELKRAVETAGTPLKLVDPSTGETFVVIPEAIFAKAQVLLDEDAALAQAQMSNAALLEFAKLHPPPQEWLEGDEEELF